MIWRHHIHKVILRLPDSWSNLNLNQNLIDLIGLKFLSWIISASRPLETEP